MQKRELYLQIARSEHEEQYRRGRSLDTRAAGALAMTATLVGMTAILATLSGHPSLSSWSEATKVILTLEAVSVFGAMACALFALLPRKWHHTDLQRIAAEFPKYSEEQLAEWLGEIFRDAVTNNEVLLRVKARLVKFCLCFVAATVLFMIIFTAVINA